MIAIHHRPGSFSERWIEYLSERKINYKVVNGYDTNIIEKLKGCVAFLWHITHKSHRDFLYANGIICAAEQMGLKVFPEIATCYQYDDKIAQKNLLESIDAPLVPTWVFYEAKEALDWVNSATFPKVFKLRRGAGSSNVKLVCSKDDAAKLVQKMFSSGFNPGFHFSEVIKQRAWRIRSISGFITKARKIPTYIKQKGLTPDERGYVYFQEFIPDNEYDNRVTIIGDRGFFFRRLNRPGDFRASGSGRLVYPSPDEADMEALRIGFTISKRLRFQSMAYDILIDKPTGRKLLTEISYVYDAKAIYNCEGYFDSNFNWHEGHLWPQDAILEDILASLPAPS